MKAWWLPWLFPVVLVGAVLLSTGGVGRCRRVGRAGLPLDERRVAALPRPGCVDAAGGASASSPSSRRVW
jgi:hypothetical protein